MSTTKIEDLTFKTKLDVEPFRKISEAVTEAAAAFGVASVALAPAMERISEMGRQIEADQWQKDADRRRREKVLGKPGVRWR